MTREENKEMEFGKLISNNSTNESFEAYSLCFLIFFLNRTGIILI